MKTWKSFTAGLLLAGLIGSASVLVAFAQAKPDGYPVDGSVGSMTAQHLQRAISHLGLDARSFAYEIPKAHVLRAEVEDYAEGKLQKTEVIGHYEVPHVGKQSFMIFVDTRDAEHVVISEDFITPSGSSESAHAWLKKPKGFSWQWNDKAVLKVGERAPLFYLIDQGKKSISFPMSVEKMVEQYPRVVVVYAILESEGQK